MGLETLSSENTSLHEKFSSALENATCLQKEVELLPRDMKEMKEQLADDVTMRGVLNHSSFLVLIQSYSLLRIQRHFLKSPPQFMLLSLSYPS